MGADFSERESCEVSLTGIEGNLLKQGINEIRRRSALTIPPEGLEAGADSNSRQAVFYILAERDENLRKLHYRLIVDQQRVTNLQSGLESFQVSDSARLQVSVDRKEWSPAINFKRVSQNYEDVVNVDTRVDSYKGHVRVFGTLTSFTLSLRYVRQESDGPWPETWVESGSATVEID